MKENGKDFRFAVCITDAESDLDKRKIYQVLPDETAAKDNYLRVIDESGENYLYPADYFVLIDVPLKERELLIASGCTTYTPSVKEFIYEKVPYQTQ